MEPGIIIELAIAGAVILASAVIGLRVQGGIGAFLLGVGALLASAITIGTTLLGLTLWENTGGWIGLIAGILLAAVLAWRVGNQIVRGRSGRFAAGLWLGFCFFCICGYLAGGPLGLLTITLPAIAVFWLGSFRVSAHILPLRDEDRRPRLRLRRRPTPDPRPQVVIYPLDGLGERLREHIRTIRDCQWTRAFRSMLTFMMGTNYPYYFIHDGKLDLRVKGNAYSQFFAGPGLAYADCDQAGYLTYGVGVRSVLEPGLNFTGYLDLEPKAIELRPQLCSFSVEAVTKDGIPIRVDAHVAFRVHPGNQLDKSGQQKVRCEPELGKSFPFRRRAVFQIAAAEPVQGRTTEKGKEMRHQWDSELVPMMTTRIIQDIVSHYDMDELCAPLDPDRAPYLDIIDSMNNELHKAMVPLGIEPLEGWLGNLWPRDESVTKRRLDNWRTEWERKILHLMSEGKAERTREIEEARAQAELKILLRFSQIAHASPVTDEASQAALALRFIDCIGEVVSESDSQWPLPSGVRETLRQLRGEIAEGRR
jgi:hypothetical protein